ncbi:MAG: HAMP domain-containing sensor histidine kinase [Bacillota bacterium]|nr:HAMP domain-containing sensor histidine kinase [Bacillota bacterium]
MKNLPLSLQIWLVFTAIALGISISLTVLFPWTLRDFFTREIYATIESAQSLLFNRLASELNREMWEPGVFADRRQQPQDIRAVNHIIVSFENGEFISFPLPLLSEEFWYKVKNEAKEQKGDSQRYSGQVGGRKIFYVITRSNVRGRNVFLVSYMWDSYREDLVQTLFKRLVLIMSFVFLLSWVPSLGLARYLSNPLVTLEKRVKKLANRDWHEPIQLQREDEIGRLGQSVEQLRTHLIRQDEAQQSFLQHISHELKTPVMVIRSYVQSIRDGIYPKGDLTSTVQVIEEEAERLEKRIRNLLYLTKLDYMATHKPLHETFDMTQLIREVIERLRWRRRDLDWSLKLSPVKSKGDIEQWRVALENLFDNQIRYAREQIKISLAPGGSSNGTALMHIWNDGPAIEQEILDRLFQKFNKGYKGEFGLGLAVVQRIASLHGAKIWAVNEEKGVSFYLEIHVAST